MTADEMRRYEQGRADWRQEDWQDHCGNPRCTVCKGYEPDGNQRIGALRRSMWLLPS